MQGFRNNAGGGWIQRKALRFWRNFARNWEAEVEDDDFFSLFSGDLKTSEKGVIRHFRRHFDLDTLESLDAVVVEPLPVTEGSGEPSEAVRLSRGGLARAIQSLWNEDGLRGKCRSMLSEWAEEIASRRPGGRRRGKEPMEARFEEVSRVLRLDEAEREILAYAMVRAMTRFDDFPVCRSPESAERAVFVAMAVDCPASRVDRALSRGATLRKFDVLDGDGDLCRGTFRDYLEAGGDSPLEGRFYRRRETAKALPWAYYGALASEHGALLRRLLRAADGRGGANVLFHGAPGTGKTSFAETLARELGLELYEIRQGDRNGEHVSSQSRLAGIRICNGQVPAPGSMMLVDEADHLLETVRTGPFGESAGAAARKGAVNSLLDEMRIPAVWIVNSPPEALDESVRRRFDYSVRFPRPGESQRRRVWRNTVAKLGLSRRVDEERIAAYARRYRTSAGGIATVLGNVRRMRPRNAAETDALVDRLMRRHCELMDAGLPPAAGEARRVEAGYSLEGLNLKGAFPPERVVEAVRRFRAELAEGGGAREGERLNILLWGPPGTGKTEFVRHLASAVDAPLAVRTGSDLLSMWVGGTERNIRAAFEQAEEEGAILFLDEIDGLVQERAGAGQHWEVTQVEELLQRMENFRGVMVGATNFMDRLDPAVLRRFAFKLEFGYLSDAGKRLFFGRMFGEALSEGEAARLERIANLAPGDFRTVRDALRWAGGEATNAMRLAELERESALKKGAPGRIGF